MEGESANRARLIVLCSN